MVCSIFSDFVSLQGIIWRRICVLTYKSIEPKKSFIASLSTEFFAPVLINSLRCCGAYKKYITLYDQTHIAPLAICYSLQIVRDKPIGAPVFVRVIYF